MPTDKSRIHSEGRVRVHRQIHLSFALESGGRNGEFVVADGKIGEGIETLPVGDGLIGRLLGRVDQA